MGTCNEDIASGVGQDKPQKQPTEAYDSKNGTYQGKPPAIGDLKQSPTTVNPFGSLK